MKSILYFVLAIITLVYIGFLCYANIIGFENLAQWMNYLAIYGGLCIALLYAGINFFGNPFKTIFFILLVLMTIVLILTIVFPDTFRSLFKMVDSGKSMINLFKC